MVPVLTWLSQLTPRNILKPDDVVVSSANRSPSMNTPGGAGYAPTEGHVCGTLAS